MGSGGYSRAGVGLQSSENEQIAEHREGRSGQHLSTIRRSQVSFGLNPDMGLVLVLLRENLNRAEQWRARGQEFN